MATNAEPLFVDPVLLQQAEQRCVRRLESEPDNRAVLRSLAEVHRKLGNLEKAAAIYARLCQLDPRDSEAGYLQAILGGKEWPTASTGIRPAPFVWVRNWLPRDFQETILPFFVSGRGKFVPVVAGKEAEYKPDVRQTLEFRGAWAGKKRFTAHLVETLAGVVPRLYIEPFETAGYEVQVRAYQDGHFFRMHRDAEPDHPGAARVINFVYYFHNTPRPYTGGELLLFDSDMDVKAMTTTSRFTRIVPEDNSIIFFPPNFYHSVVPIRCPSQDFADSRFVINGHVLRRVGARPATDDATAVAVS